MNPVFVTIAAPTRQTTTGDSSMSFLQPIRLPDALDPFAQPSLRIAVLLPCYNEEAAIGQTVKGFREALPNAAIYVYDNNSKDRTPEVARAAGAIVRRETQQGKGHVVRRMFADIDADVYVMADGDATYDASVAQNLVNRLVAENLDMVVGCRKDSEEAAYRQGHRFGNWLLTTCVAKLFGRSFTDILSGYRVFSRRFVKSFPTLANGFEIETDITVHALGLKLPVGEVETAYGARPLGSTSKLSTYRDGFRILWMIFNLFRQERPFAFYGLIALVLSCAAMALALPLGITYLNTGLVPRLPTAVLCSSLMLLAFLSLSSGLVLDTVTRGRREQKQLTYLSITAPGRGA
jgi:hypothetical protein